jgi:hypothetical protein
MTSSVATQPATSPAFARFAGYSAIITGICSLAYAVAFLILKNDPFAGLFLALGGFLASAGVLGLYQLVRSVDSSFALYGMILGMVGAFGTFIHGAYNLASAIVAEPIVPHLDTLPLQTDPRGALAFGVAGGAALILASLVTRSPSLPRGLGITGLILGVLLVALFLGNLFTGTDTKSLAILIPGGLASLVFTPVWYGWLGWVLLQGARA